MYSVHGAIRHHSLTHAHTPEQRTPKSLFLMAPTEPKTQPNRNTHSHISTVSRIQTISTIQTDPTINYVWRIEKKAKNNYRKAHGFVCCQPNRQRYKRLRTPSNCNQTHTLIHVYRTNRGKKTREI